MCSIFFLNYSNIFEQASLIGQAPPKLKGKMARMVATKAALSVRVDALTDSDGKSEETASVIGIENRTKLESRLRALEREMEGGGVRRFADNGKKQQRFEMTGETKTYNTSADQVDLVSTQRDSPMDVAIKAVLDVKEEKRKAKEERRAKKRAEKSKADASDAEENQMDVDGEDKKDKKRKRRESEIAPMDEDKPEEKSKVSMLCPMYFTSRLTYLWRRRLKRRKRQGKRPRKRLRPQPLLTALTHLRRRRKSHLRHNSSSLLRILYRCTRFFFFVCLSFRSSIFVQTSHNYYRRRYISALYKSPT